MAEANDLCKSCQLDRSSFNGEIAIHFPGLKGLERPIVWVFPTIHVCLRCGDAEFIVPDRERRVLVDGVPVEGAVDVVRNKKDR